jgi:hypothetical protein
MPAEGRHLHGQPRRQHPNQRNDDVTAMPRVKPRAIRILDPPIALRGQHLGVVPPTSRSHPWRAVSVLLGRPALEQVRRLHDRAVDRDDERNLTRYRFPRLLECPKAMSDSRASQLTGLGGRGQLRSCRRSSRSRRRAAPSLLPLPCLVGALPATPARERGSSDAGSRSRT